MKRSLLLILVLMLCVCGAFAQTTPAPSLMNFQGRLSKPDGTPVANGTYSVRFSLHTALSGGTEVWNQTLNVTVNNGVFAVLLGGAGASAPLNEAIFTGDRWLQIKIGANAPLTPRQQLVTVAFALKANSVPDGSIGTNQLAANAVTTGKLADGAVTNAKVTSVDFNKILNAPSAMPPNGAAGGDLAGTYPNPTIGANKVGNAKLASDAASLAKVSGGVMNVVNGLVGINATNPANNLQIVGDNRPNWATLRVDSGVGVTGVDWAIRATTGASQGIGLLATATGTSDTNYGVFAVSDSPVGIGLKAFASSTTGTNFGLVADTASPDGWAAAFKARCFFASKVGIGTLTPSVALSVAGGVSVDDDGQNAGNLASDALRFGGATAGEGIASKRSAGGNQNGLNFYTNNTARLLITNAGDVGIGVIPNGFKLDVGGNIRCTSLTQASDARYKQNIATIENPLDAILNLRGVTFDWKRDEFKERNFADGKQIGFIAQEVEKVLPEIVTTDKNGYKSVAYQNVVPVLVEAVKTLKTRHETEVNALKAENDALKARLEALEAAVTRLTAQSR